MNEKPTRADYRVFYPIVTRWKDNDIYGHLNNVEYYSFIDSVVNRHLIEQKVLDIHGTGVVGYVVNSGCTFLAPVGYPDALEAGIRVEKLGNSSVRYGVAVFRKGEETACAYGHLVHVFVDRATDRPVPIPDDARRVLEKITA